jgi:hypothetical protein
VLPNPLATVALPSSSSSTHGVHAQVVNQLRSHFLNQQAIGPGTISVHIRRGDKVRFKEMRFVNDSTYQSYALALYADNTDVLNTTVFANTEDPAALRFLIDNMAPWTVQYTTVSRNNHAGKSVSGWQFVRKPNLLLSAAAELLASIWQQPNTPEFRGVIRGP